MTALTRFVRRLVASLSRQRPDERLEEEFALHLEEQTAANIRAGLVPDEARRQAMLKFGSRQAMKERYRDTHGLPFLEKFLVVALLAGVLPAYRALRVDPAKVLQAD